jgi:DNA-directed RNA polymerase specialized sigma24 family protein
MDGADGEASDGRRQRQARDAELIAALRRGEPDAFGGLYDHWFDAVFDIAARLVRRRSDAVDVTAETFEVAWRRLPGLDPPEAFGGWLLRLVRNAALVRNHSARPGVPDAAPSSVPAGVETTFTDTTFTDPALAELPGSNPLVGATDLTYASDPAIEPLLWAAAGTLSARDASLLDLHLRHGLAPGEAASALGLNPAAADRQVVQLRDRLSTAVRAVALWNGGEPDCDQLTTKLRRSRIERFDVHAVRLIDRHAHTCEPCGLRHRLEIDPVELFAAIPFVVSDGGERSRAAVALLRSGVPLQGSQKGHLTPEPVGVTVGSGRTGDRWRLGTVVAAAASPAGPAMVAGGPPAADDGDPVETPDPVEAPGGGGTAPPDAAAGLRGPNAEAGDDPAGAVAAFSFANVGRQFSSDAGAAGEADAPTAGPADDEPVADGAAAGGSETGAPIEAAGGAPGDDPAGDEVAPADANDGAAAAVVVAATAARDDEAPPRVNWSSQPYGPDDETGDVPVTGAAIATAEDPPGPRDAAQDRPVVTPMPVGPATAVASLRGPNAETGLRGPNAETGLRGPNAETGLRGPDDETGQSGGNAELGDEHWAPIGVGPAAGIGAAAAAGAATTAGAATAGGTAAGAGAGAAVGSPDPLPPTGSPVDPPLDTDVEELTLADRPYLPYTLVGAAVVVFLLLAALVLVTRPKPDEVGADQLITGTSSTTAASSDSEASSSSSASTADQATTTTTGDPRANTSTTVAGDKTPAPSTTGGAVTPGPGGGNGNSPIPGGGNTPAPTAGPAPTIRRTTRRPDPAPPEISDFRFVGPTTVSAPWDDDRSPLISWTSNPVPGWTVVIVAPPGATELRVGAVGLRRIPCPVEPVGGQCNPPPGIYGYDIVARRDADPRDIVSRPGILLTVTAGASTVPATEL